MVEMVQTLNNKYKEFIELNKRLKVQEEIAKNAKDNVEKTGFDLDKCEREIVELFGKTGMESDDFFHDGYVHKFTKTYPKGKLVILDEKKVPPKFTYKEEIVKINARNISDYLKENNITSCDFAEIRMGQSNLKYTVK